MPSHVIHDFRYDEPRNELTITFTTGRGYVCSLVPPALVGGMQTAFSKGEFFNANIRDRYPYRLGTAPEGGSRASLLDALKKSNGS